MGKLTVADIENRLLNRIFTAIGHTPPSGNCAMTLEDALINVISQKEMKIIGLEQKIVKMETPKYPAPPATEAIPQGTITGNGSSLWLVSVHPNHLIGCIKLVRELTGLGLKEAKDLADKVRGFYRTWDHHNEACSHPAAPQQIPLFGANHDLNAIAARFAAIGCNVELR